MEREQYEQGLRLLRPKRMNSIVNSSLIEITGSDTAIAALKEVKFFATDDGVLVSYGCLVYGVMNGVIEGLDAKKSRVLYISEVTAEKAISMTDYSWYSDKSSRDFVISGKLFILGIDTKVMDITSILNHPNVTPAIRELPSFWFIRECGVIDIEQHVHLLEKNLAYKRSFYGEKFTIDNNKSGWQ